MGPSDVISPLPSAAMKEAQGLQISQVMLSRGRERVKEGRREGAQSEQQLREAPENGSAEQPGKSIATAGSGQFLFCGV